MDETNVIRDYQKQYFAFLEKIKQEKVKLLPKNKKIILDFLRDCELGKTILKGEKKKIGYNRLIRVAGLLRQMDNKWLKKPFNEVKQQEMDDFILGLERGLITQKNGRAYTIESQKTIKKFIRKFYKWLLGDSVDYPDLVKHVDTSGPAPEINAIPKEEIDKLLSRTGHLSHKFVIAVLFDGGLRVGEFFNLRMEDITKKEDYYLVHIKVSKTKPRTISLPLYPEIIEEYLAEHPDKKNPKSLLSIMTYASARNMIKRLGGKVLKKNVYCHLLRHSSATFYANHLNHYQMCKRYGWCMASDMPNRYVDTAGVLEEETINILRNNNGIKQTKENNGLKDELKVMKETLRELQEAEEKRKLEQELHGQLFEKATNYENKEGLKDMRQILDQIFKSDGKLIDKLRDLM